MKEKQRKKEEGHAALYTLFFAPLIFGIGIIAYELSAANSFQSSLQSDVDRIALESASSLPDRDEARSSASKELARLGLAGADFRISISDKSPEIEIEASVPHSTAIVSLWRTAQSGAETEYRSNVRAAAELMPIDAMLILSDGIDMRPGLSAKGNFDEAWGDSKWEKSSYFDLCPRGRPPHYSNDSPAFGLAWAGGSGQRWLTQSCFNPVFSDFKFAAMAISDSLASIGTNRIGLIFTPGKPGDSGADLVRALRSEPNAGFAGLTNAVSASWEPYEDFDFEIGDEACVVFSDPGTAVRGEYALDAFRTPKSSHAGCDEPVRTRGCGQMSDLLSTECLACSSLAEVVYYRGAKRPIGLFSARSQLASALDRAESEILSGGGDAELKLETELRGNLSVRPIRAIIILTDDLPAVSPAARELELARNAGISLIVVHVGRSEFQSPAVDAAEQAARAAEWKEYFSALPASHPVPSRLISVASPDALLSTGLPELSAALHRVVLKR